MSTSERTVRQFVRDMKVGEKRVYVALQELGIDDLPTAVVFSNEAPVLSPEIQGLLVDHFRIIHPDLVQDYFEKGYMTIRQVVETFGISKTTVTRHLSNIDPEWKDKSYKIPEGRRRVALLPPELVSEIDAYHKIGYERLMRGILNSLITRGLLPGSHEKTRAARFIKRNEKFVHKIFVERDPMSLLVYYQIDDKLPPPEPEWHKEIKQCIELWLKIGNKDKEKLENQIQFHLICLDLHYSSALVRLSENEKYQDEFLRLGFDYLCKSVPELILKTDSFQHLKKLLTWRLLKFKRKFDKAH